VALIFGLIFIAAFYSPIKKFLERANKIGPAGVEASATSAQEKVTIDPTPSSQFNELLRVFDNQLLLEAEDTVKADLAKRNVTNAVERERALVRIAAVAGLGFIFERAYLWIVGSQLKAMQALNSTTLPRAGLVQCCKSRKPEFLCQFLFRPVAKLSGVSKTDCLGRVIR
jgi:hypothetical protein